MPVSTDVQPTREVSRPDALGKPLNPLVVSCPECSGTGFIEDGPDPRDRCGWCPNCNGLGWYALLSKPLLALELATGLGAVALLWLALVVLP